MGKRLLILGLVVVILLAGCATATTKKVPAAKVWIKVERANIRSEATIKSEIVTTLNQGERLKVLEESRNWYKVKLPDKRIGWIHKSLVTAVKPRPK